MFRFLLLLLCAMPLYAAETVYKVVRPDGTVEFSDEPAPGAQKMQVDEVPTIQFRTPVAKPAPGAPEEKPAPGAYAKVAITSPKPEETIRSNEHVVSFAVSIKPALAKGHQVAVRLDGKEVARGTSTSMTLSEVYRGAHTVTAVVVDEKGKEIAASDPVIFYLQRHTAPQQ